MDRYVVRESRSDSGFPPTGPQMISFNLHGNAITPEAVYYEGRYGSEFPGMQMQCGSNMSTRFMTTGHANGMQFAQARMNVPSTPGQGVMISGIDPSYLASYTSNNASYIASGAHGDHNMNAAFSGAYQNRQLPGPERNKPANLQVQHESTNAKARQEMLYKSRLSSHQNSIPQAFRNAPDNTGVIAVPNRSSVQIQSPQTQPITAKAPQPIVLDIPKKETIQKSTRFDKLKALQKIGTVVFSGSIEKVLKWHKALQDVGLMVLYEIIAKCVSVRAGDSCSKHLVIRDDSGPAMQVVYYEIDFLLPELKPPCTVRVVGRMLAGSCRLQAFNVRPATGDDVATLPRRIAVATHHVAKICKEHCARA